MRSNAFDKWFKATDINWEPSAPYTSQRNGKIEREIHTSMSVVRSVLKEFRFPKRLWDEIVETVAYIKNHTISRSANSITPYEEVTKWFHLLLIFVHKDANVMFMFRIPKCVIR